MTRDGLSAMATVVLVVCAVLVTGVVVRRELQGPPAPEPPEPRPVENWEALASIGHVMGPPDAPVTVLEFSDFQCPFCKRVQPALARLRAEYPQRVRVIYRHFPLTSVHAHAFRAALASECAAAQGHFEPYHDALFAHQDSLGLIGFDVIAERSGVPAVDAFRTCLREERFRHRVERDFGDAQVAGLRGTPSIIMNGTLLPGTPTYAVLERWTQEMLRGMN